MNIRCGLVLLTLLALPACLDPVVGTQCAAGYSSCHGACVTSGSCATTDIPDGAGSEDTPAFDAGIADTGMVLDSTARDGAPADTVAPHDSSVDSEPRWDTPGKADASEADAPTMDDAPIPDDAETIPLAGADAGADDAPLSDDAADYVPISFVDAAMVEDSTSDDTGEDSSDDGSACTSCLDAEDATPGTDESTPVDIPADDQASEIDVAPPAVDGPLICSTQQSICNDQCVDLTSDPENCGDCNILCSSGVCTNSKCLVCAAEEAVCDQQCVNTATDPDNCGACAIPCASGLCSNGQCEASGTGRVIVIGHDYLSNRPAMNRILGNAVFLWPTNPVRLVVYEGAANPIAISGADGAINQVATATGRRAQRMAVAASDVPAQLATADVFLIYGQEQASDNGLNQLGTDWMVALNTFVQVGGTVVLLDGVYGANSGTCQILAQAKLFQIAHNASATGDVCTVVARGDALATGLPKTYLCEKNSVSFLMTDSAKAITTVVQDSGQIVVVHKIF